MSKTLRRLRQGVRASEWHFKGKGNIICARKENINMTVEELTRLLPQFSKDAKVFAGESYISPDDYESVAGVFEVKGHFLNEYNGVYLFTVSEMEDDL